MKSYSILAKYYNKFTQTDSDYNAIASFIDNILQQHNCVCGVDLACGTGKLTHRLQTLNYNVFGVDSSVPMLNIAMQNGGIFVNKDMVKYRTPYKVDFATIVCDGVNYVNVKDTTKLFTTIYGNLNDGGVLIFDVSSAYKLQNTIGNNIFYIDEKDQTLLWTNTLCDNKVDMDITLFERDNNVYIRSDETHTQFIHHTEDIASALKQVGFCNIETFDNYTKNKVNAETERIVFVAYKNKVTRNEN